MRSLLGVLSLLFAACSSGGGASPIEGSVSRPDGITLIRRREVFVDSGMLIEARCAAGEVLISGGCRCDGRFAVLSSSERVGEGWQCACTDAPETGIGHQTVILCSSSPSLSRSFEPIHLAGTMDVDADNSCVVGEATSVSGNCGRSLDGMIGAAGVLTVSDFRFRCAWRPSEPGRYSGVCIEGLPTVDRSQQFFSVAAAASASNSKSCAADRNAIGGGCWCPGGGQLGSSYLGADLRTQHCSCRSPNHFIGAGTATTLLRCI